MRRRHGGLRGNLRVRLRLQAFAIGEAGIIAFQPFGAQHRGGWHGRRRCRGNGGRIRRRRATGDQGSAKQYGGKFQAAGWNHDRVVVIS